MPSGAKKRKKAAAAKRKEEREPLHPQDTKLEEKEMGSSENPMEEASAEEEQEVVAKESPLSELPHSEAKGASFENAQSNEEDGSPITEKPTEISLENVEDSVDEVGTFELNGSKVKDVSNEIIEADVEVGCSKLGEESFALQKPSEEANDYPQCECEEGRDLPNMGTVVESSEFSEVTAGSDRTRLSEHRASIWNCCGLLDGFKGSQS